MNAYREALAKDAVASSSGRQPGSRLLAGYAVGGRQQLARRSSVAQRDIRRQLACHAVPSSAQPTTILSPEPSSSAQAAAEPVSQDPNSGSEAPVLAVDRVQRLTLLVESRRLYRNLIRGQHLLGLPSPLYTPPPSPEPDEGEPRGEGSQPTDSERSSSVSSGGTSTTAPSGAQSGSGSVSVLSRSGAGLSPIPSPDEDKSLKAALEAVAEMALVAEQVKASLRSLPLGFGSAIFPAAEGAASEERVRGAARECAAALRERLAAELPVLPVPSEAALHYIESRNAKYSRRVALDELQGGGREGGGGGGDGAGRASALERLEAAERVAGEIIANNIKPALKKAAEQDLGEVVRDAGAYLRGLWVRLNGGAPGGGLAALAALDLPLPAGTTQQSELAISQLSLDLEALEKRLQEASKNRENKLRKAGLQGRVQMAIQLKGLDAEVLHLSSRLAVRTLQLEMEHVYGSLEAEALDACNGVQPGGLLARDGSTTELALLVAEFALLDEQLGLMQAALEAGAAGEGAARAPAHGDSGSAAAAAAAGPVAAAAAAMGPALINEEVLGKLAAEIPDMRSRVGVADQTVFGGQGLSLTKARLQIKESMDKVREAVTFLARGGKLLGSDVATAARLFLKAALGNTLKPREVSALRRTARDLLTFVPFTIILIVPLTPLGHVLVFGFIQRYFPSFFPSQFSSRRQEIMVRYEELERQLLEAQAAAEAAEEEVELARAREAVARLTAPEPPASVPCIVDASVGPAPPGATDVESPANGAGSAAASAAAGSGGGGGFAQAASGTGAMSSVDEVSLHEATQKVKLLAEQLDEIRDDVNMGEVAEAALDAALGNGSAAAEPHTRKQ